MVRSLALILVLAVAGCAATPPVPVRDPRAAWCSHSEPRRPSTETLATMTLDEKRAALEHNRKGEAWCGWKTA